MAEEKVSEPPKRTPAQIIGDDALTQLIFEGYEVVPASRTPKPSAHVIGTAEIEHVDGNALSAASSTPTPVTEDVRHLTADEQAVLHRSLRASVNIVASTSPPKADGPGEVSVKPLEWHGPDYEDEYLAASLGERYVIRPPTGNGRWLAVVGGYFQSVEAAKAAAEAHNEARILSALVSPSIKREA